MDVNDVSIDDFVVYPNPMDNYINYNYNTNGNIELMVVDMLGQQITCDIDYHNRIIRFSDLNPGIYMLVVKSNKKMNLLRNLSNNNEKDTYTFNFYSICRIGSE